MAGLGYGYRGVLPETKKFVCGVPKNIPIPTAPVATVAQTSLFLPVVVLPILGEGRKGRALALMSQFFSCGQIIGLSVISEEIHSGTHIKVIGFIPLERRLCVE